jgi:Flp pilus assembly protein TadD
MYIGSLMAFVAAMLSKGSVAVFPAIVLVLVWWRRGRIAVADLVRVAPFVVVSIVLSIVNAWFQVRHVAGGIRNVTVVGRILGAGGAVWFYIYKFIAPVDLLFIYPEWRIDPAEWQWWLPGLGVAMLTVVLMVFTRARGALCLWLLFLLGLAPVLGFVDVYFMRYSLVADHYAYIAMAALAVGVGVAVDRLVSWLWRRGARASARLVVVVCGVMMCGLAVRARDQSVIYKSAQDIYSETLSGNDGCEVCRDNLAAILIKRGGSLNLSQAEAYLKEAVERHPMDPEPHSGLGVIYEKRGRLSDAVNEYQQALDLNPSFSEAQRNFVVAGRKYGMALADAGNLSEALEMFERVLAIDASDVDARREAGYVLLALGRASDAVAQMTEVVRLAPGSADAHGGLADAWRAVGARKDALQEYARAVALAPTSVGWRNDLGSTLLSEGRVEEAEREFRQVLRYDSQSALAHLNLGLALARGGEVSEARHELELAVRLDPSLEAAKARVEQELVR